VWLAQPRTRFFLSLEGVACHRVELEQAQQALGRVGRKHVVIGHHTVGRAAPHSKDTRGRALADTKVVAKRLKAAARDAQLDNGVGLLRREVARVREVLDGRVPVVVRVATKGGADLERPNEAIDVIQVTLDVAIGGSLATYPRYRVYLIGRDVDVVAEIDVGTADLGQNNRPKDVQRRRVGRRHEEIR